MCDTTPLSLPPSVRAQSGSQVHKSQIVNELQAICIRLPPDVSPTSSPDSPRYLCIARHADRPACVLGDGLAYCAHYQLIESICGTRATLTVDGQLRVSGRRVTPEAYINRWREALAKPVPIDRASSSLWLVRVAVFEWQHSVALNQAKPRWINPPCSRFGALLDAHGDQLVIAPVDGVVRAQLQIDLTRPNGARDAWWVADFLGYGSTRATAAPRIAIELRKPSPCHALPIPDSAGLHAHGALGSRRAHGVFSNSGAPESSFNQPIDGPSIAMN